MEESAWAPHPGRLLARHRGAGSLHRQVRDRPAEGLRLHREPGAIVRQVQGQPERVDPAQVAAVQQAILDDGPSASPGCSVTFSTSTTTSASGSARTPYGTTGTPCRGVAVGDVGVRPHVAGEFDEDIEKIDVPTLILHGTADRILSLEGQGGACTQRCRTRTTSRWRGAARDVRHPRQGGQPRVAGLAALDISGRRREEASARRRARRA